MASCLNTVWFSRGVWNVPYVSKVYLLKGSLLRSELTDFGLFNWNILDPDMAYCHNVRNKVRANGNEPFVERKPPGGGRCARFPCPPGASGAGKESKRNVVNVSCREFSCT